MAAAKLQYCDRMSNHMRSSFVRLLDTNRRSFVIRDQDGSLTAAKHATNPVAPSNLPPHMHAEDGVASFENMRKMALDIAIGKTEAPASHEKVVVAIVTIWVAIVTIICFVDLEMSRKEFIVGIAVNFNLLFFYGAPLSTILTVLKTRDSSSIHRSTMFMNTVNAIFWTAFAFGTFDYFIMVPNGIGAILGFIQMVLRLIVPSTTIVESQPVDNLDLEMTTADPFNSADK